ncbi:MAG: phosphoenolpyruvate carboxykinase (ATP) [Sphingobacteriaceae bacterium]|nr:MAG: phosphoenolpyruvate carboxykinase (ATP) [Pedobacter sp.]
MSNILCQPSNFKYLNLDQVKNIHYQLSPAELIEAAICHKEGTLADTGALVVDTGEFTGRSPKDRFIVADDITENAVWWGDVNIRISPDKFEQLFQKVTKHLSAGRAIYVRDASVCANPKYKLSLRIVTENAFQNLFANNLFLPPDQVDPVKRPEWTIIAAPSFRAIPAEDGTRQHNFSIINFSRKIILIGGTAYTGEIKKGMFSVLNFILPQQHVLSMHCSANVGQNGDTAIFFGLSGTGKTTLSTDSERALVGDDEHGWCANYIFNFEGGCYAKCVNLSADKEPQIYDAIKFGALLENTIYYKNTRTVDFADITKTENTRVAYPIHYIKNSIIPSLASLPQNIFFLTADAFGVFPPISKLTAGQAMYHFISGYTAKVAGTEAGINEPQVTFSACFGKAFLPLHPTKYAELLGEKMKKSSVNVWLVNTGWTGGAYGVGSRMKLSFTRAMVTAAIKGELNKVGFDEHPIFGLMIPLSCPDVPSEVLNPKNTWFDKSAYDRAALDLAHAFILNFKQFDAFANDEIKSASPRVAVRI